MRTRARNLDSNRRIGLRPRLAQNGKTGQRFVVNLGNQEGFIAVILLPHLADLDLFRGHFMNVDRFAGVVNILNPARFGGETPAIAICRETHFPDATS